MVADLAHRHPERGGQRTPQGGGEPGPQQTGVGLPEHRPDVIVGRRVAGSADPRAPGGNGRGDRFRTSAHEGVKMDTVTTGADLLQQGFAVSSERLNSILANISDTEFFWEPAPGCWTVHRRSERRATSADGAGEWVIDYEVPDPDPAPLTTIAWRTVHIAAFNYLYWDYAFGSANLSFDLEVPGSAAAAVEWLRASQLPLANALAETDDTDLDAPCRTNWGDTWPCHRIFTTLITEQTHHGAEISLLRDLYRSRAR